MICGISAKYRKEMFITNRFMMDEDKFNNAKMSSIFAFIKRHRNKILFGSALVGGAYLIHNTVKNILLEQQVAESINNDPLRIQARRHYIYDTNQRACDKSIVELAECLKKRIALRFDVESAISKLRNEPELSEDEKLLLWNKIKVMVIARIMAVAYSFSLLSVTLKCQISILASYICASFDHNDDSSSWWYKYMSNYFGSFTSHNTHSTINANAQQLFLKCVEELLNRIESICEDKLQRVSLRREFSSETLRELLEQIKCRLYSIDTRHFSYIVVPKFANQVFSEHTKSNDLPFARAIPVMADSYSRIASTRFDSPLQNTLCSTDLHQLTTYVFSLPPPQSVSNLAVQ
ncbi:unnamed protein product [Anisakis simplex]|uniref:Peroxisomal biogenesis factor 3 n=1 Tax=Anisakis simplex TaxID=6269 RepID=A0A0M3JRR1_ANISI|nr:unnamed protein product [Anisakis simplex]